MVERVGVEITPEMVEAGESAYYDAPRWAKDGDLSERFVTRIYLAMEAARIDGRKCMCSEIRSIRRNIAKTKEKAASISREILTLAGS